ncbi:MAG: hypothetical protein ACXAE3_12640 [Candidatus Kariarchaeaceae archaeon]|jgi:aspartyl/asparaginyl-tRNA synthetase
MISEEDDQTLELGMKSEIIIENLIVKAIHDFLEEQGFVFLLPATLSSITSKLTLQSDEEFLVDLVQSRYPRPRAFVTSYQIILHELNIENIYSVQHISSPNNETKTMMHIESANMDFEQIFGFAERMLRRVLIDLRDKLTDTQIRDAVMELGNLWRDTFSQMDEHNMELEYFEDWRGESTKSAKAPFFVTCVMPTFYDQRDTSQPGKHYLNFEGYLPKYDKPIITGGLREYRYTEIMNRMKEMGINRYDYSNYLLFLADNRLKSSSGMSINLGFLISSVIANITCHLRKTGQEE